MRIVWLLFLFFCSVVFEACAQEVAWRDFRFGSLEAVSSRDVIVKTLGAPLREYRPYYECGFFSEDEQGKIYWVLDYGYASFVGNADEGFVPETIDFTKKTNLSITYKGLKWDTLKSLFGNSGNTDGLIRVSPEGGDAVLLFTVKNGELTGFEY